MKRRYLFFTLLIIPVIGTPPALQSWQQVNNDTVSVHDGPYVFWLGQNAIVQYVCNDQVITHRFEAKDLIQIPASCEDSSRTLTISAEAPSIAPDTFEEATKICAISDIHGNYNQMIKLLKGNGVIDDKLHWNWGDGHLVITGDMFDRGANVNEALWFVYNLEKEARRDGGQVHYVLGNHEIMVLRGDLRYVNEKYVDVAKKLRIRIDDLYGPETELGRWLRTKNVIIKINDILFTHGGLSPELRKRGYTISMINRIFRNSLDARDYAIRFDEELEFLYGYKGPIWYRGYLRTWNDVPAATEQEVKSILSTYGASQVVVGHTIVETVTSLYGGKVFAIETGINRGAEGETLIWEGGVFYRADVHGKREVVNDLSVESKF